MAESMTGSKRNDCLATLRSFGLSVEEEQSGRYRVSGSDTKGRPFEIYFSGEDIENTSRDVVQAAVRGIDNTRKEKTRRLIRESGEYPVI